MCRALKVLVVAEDDASLRTLRAAAVSAEWELTPGATSVEDAIAIVDSERPHVVVTFGAFEALTTLLRERFPGMRVIADRELSGASVVVSGPQEVRAAVKAAPPSRGPVTDRRG
ncbi:MAG: hypothetical protein ACJ76P_07075 [Actinomycetota bacterium]